MNLKTSIRLIRQLNSTFENGFNKRHEFKSRNNNNNHTHHNHNHNHNKRTERLACRLICMILMDVHDYMNIIAEKMANGRRQQQSISLPYYSKMIVNDCILSEKKSQRVFKRIGHSRRCCCDERLPVKSVVSFFPFHKHRFSFVRKTKAGLRELEDSMQEIRMQTQRDKMNTVSQNRGEEDGTTKRKRENAITSWVDILADKLHGCVYLVDHVLQYEPIQHPVASIFKDSYFHASDLPSTFLLAARSRGGARPEDLTGQTLLPDYLFYFI